LSRVYQPDYYWRYFLTVTAFLLGIGLLMVPSASVAVSIQKYGVFYYFIRQIAYIIIGLSVMLVVRHLKMDTWRKISGVLYWLVILLLLAVLVKGERIGGARRWLNLGFFNFQPSQLMKIALIVALADYLDRQRSRLKKFSGLIFPFVLTFIPIALIARQPDIGIPALLFLVMIILFFWARARLRYIFLLFLIILPLVAVEIKLHNYRMRRLEMFWEQLRGGATQISWQVSQSILAIGSGGWFGKGLGNGQIKLKYLPAPHTDFIFAIIGEELGWVGSTTVIILFCLWAWWGLKIAGKAPDFFSQLLCAGLVFVIFFQAAFNIMMNCGLLPTKGLPLPFISFSGSELVMDMMAVGIIGRVSDGK
jgi:cell division protein FtsW